MSMNIKPVELAEFDLVEVKSTNDCNPTPHCKLHGAMNKMTKHDDGGGIWRCVIIHSMTKIVNGNSVSWKERDCVCRAGCVETRPKE